MNHYLKSIDTLDNWWLSMNQEWHHFLAANYYYSNDRHSFYELGESILNQNFMDDWMFDPLIPAMVTHAFKAERLLDPNYVYMRKGEENSFSFDITTIHPAGDLHNLKELSITNLISDFDISVFRNLSNLETIILDEKFIRQIPDLLALNLPKLKKLTVALQPYFNRADFELLQNASKTSKIEIEEFIYQDRPIFYLS